MGGRGQSAPLSHQMQEDHHRFTLYVSFPDHAGLDRTAFSTLPAADGRDMGLPLAWMAANHYDNSAPHTPLCWCGA